MPMKTVSYGNMKVESSPIRESSQTTVLIIDDDQNILDLLELSLRRDYIVYTESNGIAGLKSAFDNLPSIIICDWKMPGMDGMEICRRLKENPNTVTSYFILLTAHGDVDDRVLALDTGADDFIQKPPNIKELRARLRSGLRIRHLSQALQKKQREMEFDLQQARAYVLSLLPDPIDTVHYTGIRIRLEWTFIPSAELGGDIFQYHWIDDDRLVIYLLDVAGHGVGAALLSVSVLNILNSGSINADRSKPADVLNALNELFLMEKQNNLFFTIWYGVLDLKNREIRYATAGHPPAIYMNAHGNFRLKAKGIPIGMDCDRRFEEMSVRPGEEGLLTVYSDGVYDCITSDNPSDLNNWIDYIENMPSKEIPHNLKENLDYLLEAGRSICNSDKFDDDISIIQLSLQKV